MPSYCIVEVPEALGNPLWSSPMIIVPPHYFLLKSDDGGQYVKYLKPPEGPERTGLLKDLIQDHPCAQAPSDWDVIKVNLKSVANSYEQAQLEALTYAKKALTAYKRKQNAQAKTKKSASIEMTSINSFIQETLPMVSPTSSASSQNFNETSTCSISQDPSANSLLVHEIPQVQQQCTVEYSVAQQILDVPNLEVVLTETATSMARKSQGLSIIGEYPEMSLHSAYSTTSSLTNPLLNNGMDSLVTKQDLEEMGDSMIVKMRHEVEKCLNDYYDKKCRKELQNVTSNLQEIKNITMKSVPVVQLSDSIPLEELKIKFNLKLPMVTGKRLIDFGNLLEKNVGDFRTKIKKHIMATTSSKLDLMDSLRLVIRKFLGKKHYTHYTLLRDLVVIKWFLKRLNCTSA
ncbi:hypothetical protein QAD02_021777 [Eretmocerus hayati]|uniref:Uncharacterized protein n=1 Tax=Eretmocerus hayati TaxID=131215 RepID=A0ACC2PTN5_9HYME|nr:hypothetical protein QAD02_021777 [Eretmocerus hayati]